MLDIDLIRKNPKYVEESLQRKGYHFNSDELLKLDKQKRENSQIVENLKAEKNRISATIPVLKKEGKDTSVIFAQMKELSLEIQKYDEKVDELQTKINDIMFVIPNMPDDDVVAGGKENNVVLRTFKDKPKFDFKPKSHIELCEDLGLIDYERGAKIAGNGSWVYRGLGARLEWAILNFFISEHIKDGYEFMLLPHMLNYECGFGAGQFPKFSEEVYWVDCNVSDKNGKFMLPTAETALVNLYRKEVIDESELPKKFAGYTPCYRREAGSYRSEERGMIRGHQFNKVEMVIISTPKQSKDCFEELVKKAENLVQKLGLHYQISKLAAEDCSASMRRTYDIEVFIPSMNIYKEVSSVSNAGDYQARRNQTKYRNKETNKLEFVHTLNASGLATSRVFPAIIEQYQNADGSITIPEVLRPFMGGLEKIEKVK